jgi:hypothetical protein
MPIYLYTKKPRTGILRHKIPKVLTNSDYFVSPIKIINPKYKRVVQYDIYKIENISYTNIPKGINYHILNNSPIIPVRVATKIIINKKTLVIRVFEKYDVLKDYKITSDELVFVVYYINNAIKVYYGNFHNGKEYNICTSCSSITTHKIKTCNMCGIVICNNCSILNPKYCDDCTKDVDTDELDSTTDSEDYSDKNSMLDKMDDDLMDNSKTYFV